MKADVLALVTALSANQADQTAISEFYDNVVQDLSRRAWLTNVSLVTITAGTSQYTLVTGGPPAQVKLIAVFYDDTMLDELDLVEADMIDKNWRDDTGPPRAYVIESEAAKTFRLYPAPDVAGKPLNVVFGEPFGRDYPTYNCAIVHTETRQNVPPWLEFPLALEVLSREYAYESEHKDAALSALAHQFSELCLQMVY